MDTRCLDYGLYGDYIQGILKTYRDLCRASGFPKIMGNWGRGVILRVFAGTREVGFRVEA